MGPRSTPPPLPPMEFNVLPEGHWKIGMNVRECNWVQAVEGGIDSAHSAILHSTVDFDRLEATGVREFLFQNRSHAPLRYQVHTAEAGVIGGARRPAIEDGFDWWRCNVFVMPFYTMVPERHRHAQRPRLRADRRRQHDVLEHQLEPDPADQAPDLRQQPAERLRPERRWLPTRHHRLDGTLAPGR